MDLIDKLKEEGYDVVIRHERATTWEADDARARRAKGERSVMPSTHPKHLIIKAGLHGVSPHGGKTTAVISLDGEEIARGVAVCSPTDNFSKHEGRMKALGRAVSVLRAKEDS